MSAYSEMMKGKHSGELGKIEYAIWVCEFGGATKAVQEAAAAELALYREAYRLLLLCRNEYPGTLYVTYEKDGRNVRDMTDELKKKMEGLTK